MTRSFAKGPGTAFLLATVFGSGIVGKSPACGNIAIAPLGNRIATGTMLCVLIAIASASFAVRAIRALFSAPGTSPTG